MLQCTALVHFTAFGHIDELIYLHSQDGETCQTVSLNCTHATATPL